VTAAPAAHAPRPRAAEPEGAAPTFRLDPELHVVVVSDLHLGDGAASDPFGGKDALFLEFLDHVRDEADALVIAGDGFDLAQAWTLARIRAAHGGVLEGLARLAHHLPVFYLQGNHDGAATDLAPHLPFRFGRSLAIGERVLVEHGNAFDARNLPGDRKAFWGARAHATIERVIRSPVRIPMRKHYRWSTRLGHWVFYRYGAYRRAKAIVLRRLGRDEAALRCLEFLDYWGGGEWGDIHALLEPAAGVLAGSGCGVLVWGHAHQAGRVVMPGGVYANTGSWTYADSTYAVIRDGDVTVREWPSQREIGDEEYRGALDRGDDRSFFDWWARFYRGWFRYDVDAMHRAARGDRERAGP